MTSFCIKINNKKIIDYLLNNCKDINLGNIILSNKVFKFYENTIIHYTGNDVSSFYNSLADVIANCIIKFYEHDIIKKLINTNYFYFSSHERKQIFNNTLEQIQLDDDLISRKKHNLYISVLKYIVENKSMILDGFVNFRIFNYIKNLDYVVDLGVNKFLIEREYTEFISLLRLYINSKEPGINSIHLIYTDSQSILIDNDKNIISIEDNIFNAKYLSDITFSSNDYALNTLLSIIPEKIIIHLVDEPDEFINTLNLIFENRIIICTDCSICETYRIKNNKKILH